MYCGNKDKVPKGKTRGTPNECFLKGRTAGFVGGVSKGIINLNQRSLNNLRKDVVREIAYRFRVRGYSNMTKPELIAGIIRNKPDNVNTYNLDNFKNR